METLPDLARYVNQWAAERRQLNQSFAQLQQMFKTTITANLLGENKYPISIEDLQPNTQLEHYQRQLDSLLGRKDQINSVVDALNDQIDASENKLSDWVKSDLAKGLFRWPN